MIEALIPAIVGLISGAGGAVVAAKMAIARLEVLSEYQREGVREVRREVRAAHYRLDLIGAPHSAAAPD